MRLAPADQEERDRLLAKIARVDVIEARLEVLTDRLIALEARGGRAVSEEGRAMSKPARLDVSWREWHYEGTVVDVPGLRVGDSLPMREDRITDADLAAAQTALEESHGGSEGAAMGVCEALLLRGKRWRGEELSRGGRLTDRCTICGRFVGHYPNGFYCDSHCYRCFCMRCPEFLRTLHQITPGRPVEQR